MSARRRILVTLALALGACHNPTLWIGELPTDAGKSAEPPSMPVEEKDASEVAPVAHDASVPTPPDKPEKPPEKPPETVPPMDGPTSAPMMRDASVTQPVDDNDAGSGFPWETDQPKPTRLPAVRGRCPELSKSGTYTFGDPRSRTLSVDIYILPDAKTRGGPGGPIILYFHAIGSNSKEVVTGFGQTYIDAATMLGGVVASFSAKLCATCGLSEDVQWYPQDDAVSDQVVACAIEQAHIDTRRIHAMGFSAGAMHSLHLALARSDYIASVVSYSGGRLNEPEPSQDPSNHVPVLLSYGRSGLDFAGVDFSMLSLQWYEEFKAKGWYTMLCDHQGGHVIPPDLAEKAVFFLADHSYKFTPEPYEGGVPSYFPDYCSNTPRMR